MNDLIEQFKNAFVESGRKLQTEQEERLTGLIKREVLPAYERSQIIGYIVDAGIAIGVALLIYLLIGRNR